MWARCGHEQLSCAQSLAALERRANEHARRSVEAEHAACRARVAWPIPPHDCAARRTDQALTGCALVRQCRPKVRLWCPCLPRPPILEQRGRVVHLLAVDDLRKPINSRGRPSRWQQTPGVVRQSQSRTCNKDPPSFSYIQNLHVAAAGLLRPVAAPARRRSTHAPRLTALHMRVCWDDVCIGRRSRVASGPFRSSRATGSA